MPKPIIIAALILAAMMLSLYLGIKSVDWLPPERAGAAAEYAQSQDVDTCILDL